MTETTEAPSTDGRVARRQRNRDAVVDVVLEMFGEDMLFPTIEQVSQRSGLSPRSVYRYFADPAELLEAAIQRSREAGFRVSRLPNTGQGPFETRAADFAAMRIRLHELMGAAWRATTYNAARLPRLEAEQAANRALKREQFELQFAPELDAMSADERVLAVEAGDVLTSMNAIEELRRHNDVDPATAESVLVNALRAVLRA